MPSKIAPKSGSGCKKVEKQKTKQVLQCVECKNQYHEIFRPMFQVQISSISSRTTYICEKCKYPELYPAKEKKSPVQTTTQSREQIPSAQLLSSTPAHRVGGSKAPTAVKPVAVREASLTQRNHASPTNVTPSHYQRGRKEEVEVREKSIQLESQTSPVPANSRKKTDEASNTHDLTS